MKLSYNNRSRILTLFLALIFCEKCLGSPISLEENEDTDAFEYGPKVTMDADADRRLEGIRSVRQSSDDSDLFSSPGESSGDKVPIMSVQSGSGTRRDEGLFSSPDLNRREPFLFTLKRFLLDQIRGEGRSDDGLPWHKRLGQFLLNLIQQGVSRFQSRYNGNLNGRQTESTDSNLISS